MWMRLGASACVLAAAVTVLPVHAAADEAEGCDELVIGAPEALDTMPSTTFPSSLPAVPAAPVPATLTVAVVPSAVVLQGVVDQPILISIANAGTEAVTGVRVDVRPPPAVEWTVGPIDSELPGGRTLIVQGRLVGRLSASDATTVLVQGSSKGRNLVSTATITHGAPSPLASLAVTGGTKLTNGRDLELTATVTNSSAYEVRVDLTASTSGPTDRIEVAESPCPIAVGPGATETLELTIGGDRLAAAAELASIEAVVTAGGVTQRLTATHKFETTPFADSTIVGPLGLASLLLLPGAVGLTAWSAIRGEPRRRRGRAVTRVPDMKSLGTGVGAIVISAAAIEMFRILGGDSLYDGYSVATLAVVSVIAGGVLAVAALLRWWYIEWRYPVLRSDAKAASVLGKVREWELSTASMNGTPGHVLWEHDGTACVIPVVVVQGASAAVDTAVKARSLKQLRAAVAAGADLTVGFEAVTATGLTTPATGAIGDAWDPSGGEAFVRSRE